MTPVDQLFERGNPDNVPGDCVRACIASIFDLPILTVPHFVQLHNHEWAVGLVDWCELQGIVARWSEGDICAPVPYMLCGPSPRVGRHACVYLAGELLHDPHSSKSGLRFERRGEHDPIYFQSWIFEPL